MDTAYNSITERKIQSPNGDMTKKEILKNVVTKGFSIYVKAKGNLIQ